MKYLLVLFVLVLSSASSSFAADDAINTKSISDEGFGDVSKILDSMTPEQREEVKRQAESMRPELEAMTPEERQNLENQMKDTLKTIDTSKTDTKKLDPGKSKGLKGIQSDIEELKKTNSQKVKK